MRTLKENLLWVRTFDIVEDLRRALLEFRETYNNTWLIERRRYLTPEQFHQKSFSPTQWRRRVQSGVPEIAGGTGLTRRFDPGNGRGLGRLPLTLELVGFAVEQSLPP
jgi:hypothetical protein